MNLTRPLTVTVLLVVPLAQLPAFASENCDISADTECSTVARLIAIGDAADQVQFNVDAFNTLLQDVGDPRLRVISSMVNRLGAKAGQIQTITEVALDNLGNQGQDIEAIAFIVLVNATNDMDKDLQEIMAQVKAMTNAKQKLRDLINLVNKDVADEADNDFNNIVIGVSDLVDLVRSCALCSD
jgi:hypothetical protein